MAYGWTPKQLVKINARREASGRKTFDPESIGRRNVGKYYEEYEKRKSKKNKKLKDEEMEDYCENNPNSEECIAWNNKKKSSIDLFKQENATRKALRSPAWSYKGAMS